MTNKVWMVGMMLIAFVIGMLFSGNTTAQQGEVGRWQVNASEGDAWKIDTVTGETWVCVNDGGTLIGGQVFGGASGCFLRANQP